MKSLLRPRLAQLSGALFLSALFTGCVSSKYAMVAHRGPSTPLELHGTKDPLKSSVEHVIVRHGPGSWKREAFWDEYQLTLANHHRSPIVVQSVRLIDAKGIAWDPGENWWQLESEGRAWWSREALGQNAALGTRAALVGAGKIVAPVGATLAVLALYGLPLAGPGIATIVFPLLTEGMNLSNETKQREITDEFESRRIHLPATIGSGSTLSRSAFFRISPTPQRLILAYQINGDFREVTIDLAALAGFHANHGLNLDPIPTPIAPLRSAHETSPVSSTQ